MVLGCAWTNGGREWSLVAHASGERVVDWKDGRGMMRTEKMRRREGDLQGEEGRSGGRRGRREEEGKTARRVKKRRYMQYATTGHWQEHGCEHPPSECLPCTGSERPCGYSRFLWLVPASPSIPPCPWPTALPSSLVRAAPLRPLVVPTWRE